MKKAVIAAGCLMAAASMLVGFENAKEPALTEINTSVAVTPGTRIAVVSKSTKGQFWTMIRQGMDAAIDAVNESYGFTKSEKVTMTFEGPDDEQLVEDQINTLDAVLAENPDAVCISAGDMESCQAQLEAAQENGIPVIVFDANVVDTDLICAFRATDNEEVGREAAEALADAMEEEGQILVFSAQEKTESIQNRVKGFQETMESYPEIEIVNIYYSDQVEDMTTAMTEALEEYPEVDGVFCTNADSAELYLSLDSSLRDGILLVGVDATTRQQEAIKNGEEVCAISQDPLTLGYETLLTAIYAAQEDGKEEIVRTILFQPQRIDANNIYNPQYTNYLYKE
jgi:ribose transport system substrate-binding protein